MRSFKTVLLTAAALMTPAAFAQTNSAERAQVAAYSGQDYCITVMGTFPNEGTEARYQFYKLVQDMGRDAGPDFQAAINTYGENKPQADTPLLDVIDVIANPVIRQAAPEIVVSNMGHLIEFADRCAPYVDGQILSLSAFDASLTDGDTVIAEDALYLRQILSESLDRLGINDHPLHGPHARAYARSLVTTRNAVEYAAFESEIDELESLFMSDLDGRLARSNDIINEESNREILGDAVTLANDINDDAEEKQKQRDIETLFRILGGR